MRGPAAGDGAWGSPPPPGHVLLPSGRGVVGLPARGLGDLTPPPTLVVRLDRAGRPTGPHLVEPRVLWIDWPDFRTPRDTGDALRVLREALDATAGERVAVACRGGRGRTGTAIAALAVLDGVAPAAAVAWVRARFRPEAVETRSQERWVTGLRP